MTRAQSQAGPAAVVFDCDGVLIESVDLKTAAFVELFSDHPEHAAAIAEHHLAHLGISRYEKFRWIHRELLERELADSDLQELGRRYRDLVAAGTRACPEVPGTTRALAALRATGVALFVASGTPQAELDTVISSRGWTESFAGIYGSPRSKPEVLASIARTVASPPSRLIFVGDGSSDHRAAQEAGTVFVLRETAAQAERFPDYRGPRIQDLENFAAKLPELFASGRARGAKGPPI